MAWFTKCIAVLKHNRHAIRQQRPFSSEIPTHEIVNRCELNIVSSPYPPIADGPYLPLYEFLSQDWKPHGGYLDEKVAIIDGSTGLKRTFRDYYKTTGSIAASLVDMGVKENGCVAIFAPNHVDYLPITLGVSLTGAKLTPVNPLYTANELATILENSLSSVLFAHVGKLEIALDAVKRSKHVKHVVVITDDGEAIPEGTIDIEALRHHHKPIHKTGHHIHRTTDTHTLILPYSSGTTGLPKGVCLSHSNIVTNLLQANEIEGIPFAPDHKLISPLPFFHIYGFTVSLLYTAWRGHTLITNSRQFDMETFCKLVEEHRPQRAHLVPPILVGLAKHPIIDKYDMSSLHMIVSAAAPLGRETEEAVRNRLGCEVKQGWGMSELSPLGTLNSDYNMKSGSVGPLVSSTIAKVIDENGMSLGPNCHGEFLLKGPQVMIGYLNDPDRTAECLAPSGWLRTGDMAHYDEEGYFYISDRIKELIKVKGFPVAPAELEELLLEHEAVNDAAVVQVPHEASGEVPRAFIVLKQGVTNVTENDIYEWTKDRVVHYKRLEGGVVFVDSIPKSASGKILRRLLRDQGTKDPEKE